MNLSMDIMAKVMNGITQSKEWNRICMKDPGISAARDDERAKFNLGLSGGPTNCVNEPGLYSLVLGSRKAEARAFKRWITHDVIPSIRRTGSYTLPRDYPSALRALADEAEKNQRLTAKNEAQRQEIADFQPIRQYMDTILSSRGVLATTQIAADYGISVRKLNQILHEEGIQRCVNGQRVLYRDYMRHSGSDGPDGVSA